MRDRKKYSMQVSNPPLRGERIVEEVHHARDIKAKQRIMTSVLLELALRSLTSSFFTAKASITGNITTPGIQKLK